MRNFKCHGSREWVSIPICDPWMRGVFDGEEAVKGIRIRNESK